MWRGISGSLRQSWVGCSGAFVFSFCNHAEQLQHQRSFQPLLLWDSQGQPWPVVSRIGWDVRSRWLGMAKGHCLITGFLYFFISVYLSVCFASCSLYPASSVSTEVHGCTPASASGCCCCFPGGMQAVYGDVFVACWGILITALDLWADFFVVEFLKSIRGVLTLVYWLVFQCPPNTSIKLRRFSLTRSR